MPWQPGSVSLRNVPQARRAPKGTPAIAGAWRIMHADSPRPPNVPLLRALWSLLDGIWGFLKGSWGVLAYVVFSVMAWFLSRDYTILAKKGLHRSLQVATTWTLQDGCESSEALNMPGLGS